MADFNALEALINANIKKNGVQAITGNILNGILRGMVSALGKGYTIAGSVTPSSDPGTMTGPVAYIAYTAGTYTHFDGLEVEQGEVAMLIYNEAEWHKEVLYSLAANATVDGNVGTPEVGVSFVDGLLTFDFRNMKGEPGVNGQDGEAAGFGAVTASVDASVGTPSVTVSSSGPNTAKSFAFSFHNLKGEQGVQGIQGIQGPQGVQGEQGIQGPVGVESCVVTVDNTSGTPSCSVSLVGQVLHLDFTGLKGAQGDTGSSVDYPFTIVNNLTTNDATQALSAAMGVELAGQVSQLEAEVDELDQDVNGTPIQFVPTWQRPGYYLSTSGVPTSLSGWNISAPLTLKKGQTITVETQGSGFCVIAQTDANGESYTPLVTVGAASGLNSYSYKATEQKIIAISVKWETGDATVQTSQDGIRQLQEDVVGIKHTAGLVFINQNANSLPNFDTTAKTLDLGDDPVIHYNGVRYQPKVTWASDTSKYRSINYWVSSYSALWLVFKTSDCTFAFRNWSYTLGDNEVIIGGLRILSGTIIPNMPFDFSIDGVVINPLVINNISQGRRMSIISTGSSSVVLPDLNTTTRVFSLGADTGVEIGGESHIGTNNKSVTIPSGSTAYRVWFDTSTKELSVTSYAGTYPGDKTKILLGGIRWAYDGSICADFPFPITFNGDKSTAGNYYNPASSAHFYNGEKLVVGGTLKVKKQIDYSTFGTITHSGAQGMTIYADRYLVRLFNGGGIALFDLSAGAKLGEFNLASADGNNHANCANFGAKYSSEDTLPLLYVSEAYGQYRCFVERIANSFSSSSLVQTISFSGVLPDSHSGNSFAVDTLNERLYMVIHTPEHNVLVKVFNLPSISEQSVTYTASDVIDSFLIEGIENIMQGVTYENGKLLMPFGYGNSTYPSYFVAIDTDRKKITTSADMSFISGELEDVTIADNSVVLCTTGTTIYYIDF